MERGTIPTDGGGADPAGGPREGARAQALTFVLVLGVLGALGLAIWAWADDESAGPNTGVSVQDVVEDAEDYLGEQVTVSGEVGEVEFRTGGAEPGRTAFTIGDDAFGTNLLVVEPGAVRGFLDEDSVVQVTGTVRRFDPERFGDAFDDDSWFTGDVFEERDEQPVVVAQSIDPTVPITGTE